MSTGRARIALLAASILLLVAAPAGATAKVRADRLAGATRSQTALQVSRHQAFAQAAQLVVVSGADRSMPDALVAGSLGAPVVLSPPDSLGEAARTAVEERRSTLSGGVLLIGGMASLSPGVEQEVRDLGVPVTRVAGADRYETAAAVARLVPEAGGAPEDVRRAVVASGESVADALAAAALARTANVPLLLTGRDAVPAATSAELDRRRTSQVLVVGGEEVVAASTSTAIEAGVRSTQRLAGSNRYSTAAALSRWAWETLSIRPTSVVLGSGTSSADAVAGGALAGGLRVPLLLSPPSTLPQETQAELDRLEPTVAQVWVIGGSQVLSDPVVAAAVAAAQTVQND